MARNEEREFRLRPRTPRTPASRNDGVPSTPAFKLLMHYAGTAAVGEGRSLPVANQSGPIGNGVPCG